MEREKSKKDNGSFSALKAVAIAISVIGIAVSLYSAYAWLSFGSGTLYSTHHGLPFGANYTGGNFISNGAGFNSTATRGGFAGSNFAFTYIEGIIIGVLLLIIGLVVFQYERLKAALK